VYFGVLSISQPLGRASLPEVPGFAGFYRVFLELAKIGVVDLVYLLWDMMRWTTTGGGQAGFRASVT
jgi:hypothetical protein